jgi:hypothetical protein
VEDVPVQLGESVGLEDALEDTELRFLLRLEALRVIEHLAVPVAEDVRRVPAGEAEQPRLQTGRDKDRERVRLLSEQAGLDRDYLANVLARHRLEGK